MPSHSISRSSTPCKAKHSFEVASHAEPRLSRVYFMVGKMQGNKSSLMDVQSTLLPVVTTKSSFSRQSGMRPIFRARTKFNHMLRSCRRVCPRLCNRAMNSSWPSATSPGLRLNFAWLEERVEIKGPARRPPEFACDVHI